MSWLNPSLDEFPGQQQPGLAQTGPHGRSVHLYDLADGLRVEVAEVPQNDDQQQRRVELDQGPPDGLQLFAQTGPSRGVTVTAQDLALGPVGAGGCATPCAGTAGDAPSGSG